MQKTLLVIDFAMLIYYPYLRTEVVHLASTLQLHTNDKTKTAHNPYTPLSESELLYKLETSREHAAQGKIQNADDVLREMRTKYEL